MQHPLFEQVVYGDIHCRLQITVFQFLDFHARVEGTFLQKILGIAGKTDDDFFDIRILFVRKKRSRQNSLAENIDYVWAFGKAFSQKFCGFDASEL